MKRLLYAAALGFLCSCQQGGPEFLSNEAEYGNLEYCFVESNPDSVKVKFKDVLFLNMDYCTMDGTKLYSTMDVAPDFRMYANEGGKGTIEQALAMMHKGDSAIFRVDAGPFFQNTKKTALPKGINPDDKLVFHVRMNNVFDGAEYQRQIDEYNERMEAQEMLILHDYIRNENITVKPSESGLYKIITKPGQGSESAAGKTVTVHFVGSFIDGREFDNSYTRNQPFTFQLGNKKSIPGFEEGIATMRKGEKCRLIFPSTLGYGSRGVKDRIPAFATLIFDIELLDFK